MKKQIGLKLEEGLIGRIDAAAGARGLSRTGWLEWAVLGSLKGVGEVPDVPVPVRPAKPVRLAAASGALTSAQAKVGVKPIDWKSARAGEGA